MKIQVNTDTHVDGHERVAAHVSATIKQALSHVSDHVTRVEAHLSDENGDKSGPQDQRCMLEARLEGRQPVAVTEHAATQEQAVSGAAHKLAKLLESMIGRQQAARKKGADMPVSDSDTDSDADTDTEQS